MKILIDEMVDRFSICPLVSEEEDQRDRNPQSWGDKWCDPGVDGGCRQYGSDRRDWAECVENERGARELRTKQSPLPKDEECHRCGSEETDR